VYCIRDLGYSKIVYLQHVQVPEVRKSILMNIWYLVTLKESIKEEQIKLYVLCKNGNRFGFLFEN
jgi:hypothetical protein